MAVQGMLWQNLFVSPCSPPHPRVLSRRLASSLLAAVLRTKPPRPPNPWGGCDAGPDADAAVDGGRKDVDSPALRPLLSK